jgi:uncharacterized protein YodC (DUF2158 family)
MKVVSLGTQKPTPKPHGRYKAGDVVQLMSGGVAMTVSRSTKDVVSVQWMNEAGDLNAADFASAMVCPAELVVETELEPDGAA